MKPKILTNLATLLVASQSIHAATQTWDGSEVGLLWSDPLNWTTAAPVAGDTAIFSGTSTQGTTVDLGAGAASAILQFDAAALGYTIGAGAAGSQSLTLDNTGAVTKDVGGLNNQLVNAKLVLGTAIVGTTTITNSATGSTLTLAGGIEGGTGGTAATKTVNTTGAGAINISGPVTAGGASVINLANIGAGNTTLSGAGSSSVGTLRATAAGTATVNGQSVTVASSSVYGTGSTNFGKFILTSGSAAFNGGIQSATASGAIAGADGMAFIVNGGTFSASSVSLGRSAASAGTGAGATITTAANMSNNGFQVNGGTATISGQVNLSGSNSAANGQVSGTGDLSIGGQFIIGGQGNTGTTRTTIFQVTGGRLTNTDATNGIVIGRGNTAAASGELLLTGGTTTTEKISFGLNAGLAGSFGNLTLNGAGANLYVGSGGIVLAATNAYTLSTALMNGTLGAKADWSTSVALTLAGSGVKVKAADEANVARNITFNGAISGTGFGFEKTGGGTVTLAVTNSYTGATTVTAGTLIVNGNISTSITTVNGGTIGGSGTVGALTVNSGGTLAPGNSAGVLNTGNLLLAANSTLTIELNGTTVGTGYDQVNTVGSANLAGLLSLTANQFFAVDTAFTILENDASDAITGTFSGLAEGASVFSTGSVNEFRISYFGGSGNDITLTVIPEPSAALLGGIGMLCLLRRRRA